MSAEENKKLNEIHKAVTDIQKYIAVSEVIIQQQRKEIDSLTTKVETHEKTQTRAYALFAAAGLAFTTFINYLLKH